METSPGPHEAHGYVDASAHVDAGATVHESARVWGLAQIREGAVIGSRVTIGRGAYVGVGVVVGDNSKIQNNAMVYEPAHLAEGVFVGPGAILTNDRRPRATHPDGSPKRSGEWRAVGVTLEAGASIGAGAICVAPVTIGAWAMVAAGAVVTRDVAPHSLVAGVPARHIGWVGRSGARLVREKHDESVWACPESGARFQEHEGRLAEVRR